MNTSYKSNDGKIEISVRSCGFNRAAWSLFIGGSYKSSKVLPNNNTAVVQNFGYAAADFVTVAA